MKLAFRYSLFVDLRWLWHTFLNARRLEERGLAVFRPSLWAMATLWLRRPEPADVEVEFPVTCYWISSGTWGAFTPPDRILLCPRKKDGGFYSADELRRVIRHELFHLYYYEETRAMSHADREAYINRKTAKEREEDMTFISL